MKKILTILLFSFITLVFIFDMRVNAKTIKFNTNYVKEVGGKIKIKNAIQGKIKFIDYDEDLFIQKKRGSQLQACDILSFGGGISKVTVKYDKKYYTKLIGYGNIIPYDIVVKKGNKKCFFNKNTKKVLNRKNIKFKVIDPSIATVTANGTVIGKKYGNTIVTVKWKGHKGYSKIYVLPTGLRKSDVYYEGYMGTYADDHRKFPNKNYYKYYVNDKAIKQMSSSFIKVLYGVKFNQDPLRVDIVDKKSHLYDWVDDDAIAVYRPGYNQIIIRKSATSPSTAIHQFGHFIDCYNAPDEYFYLSDTFVYQQYYKAYSKQFKKMDDSYGMTNSTEYFAECYMLYVISPYYMKKHLPNSYKWMHQFMQSNGYNK